MSFDFDTGNEGSQGPWLQWSARGTQDGAIPPQKFFYRDEGGKSVFEGFAKGVILDVQNMRTGWCFSSGVTGQAPDWKWNPTLSSFAPKPGEEYKKGIQVRCAIGGGKVATWEQAGAAVWNAFTALVPAIQAGELGQGKLPVVRMTGAKLEKFARGSTSTPILEIIKWVDRPACLMEGAAAGIAIEPAPVATAAPVAKAVPAPSAAAEFAAASDEF